MRGLGFIHFGHLTKLPQRPPSYFIYSLQCSDAGKTAALKYVSGSQETEGG